ncbi:MAG: DUF1444 family protein [Hyphomicrobiaceae bacterium]
MNEQRQSPALWRLVVLFLALVMHAMPAAAKSKASPREFIDRSVEALKLMSPNWNIKILDEWTLQVAIDDAEKWLFDIGNAFRAYHSEPHELHEAVSKYVNALAKLIEQSAKSATVEDVVALVRNCEELKQWQERDESNRSHQARLIVDRFVGELCITYGIDRQSTISYLNDDVLREVGLSRKDLRAKAVENLRLKIKPAEIDKGDGFYLVGTNDGHTSGLMLLDEFWDIEKVAVLGDYIVFPVSRDSMAIVGSRSRIRQQIAAKAQELVRDEPYPLSANGYERRDNKWILWQGK